MKNINVKRIITLLMLLTLISRNIVEYLAQKINIKHINVIET